MRFFTKFTLILLISTIACSNKKTVVTHTADVELETLLLVPDSLAMVDSLSEKSLKEPLYDEYVGSLPCADCPGIDYRLTLNENGSYSESISYADLTEYQDKAVETYIYDGHFTVTGDTVFLDKEDDAVKYFLIQPEGLLLLDSEKEIMEGNYSEQYLLARKTDDMLFIPDSDDMPIARIPVDSLDFFAIGREPDWRLEMDFDSTMIFASLESQLVLALAVPDPEQTEDLKIANYFVEADDGVLDITIMSESCLDELSGQHFPFQVRVEAKDSTMTEFTSFEGCGQYTVDPLLENLWTLTAINSDELHEDDFPGGLPIFEFQLNSNRVKGFTGCNRIDGDCIIKGEQITFNSIAATKMVCENVEFEQMLIEMLSHKTFIFNRDVDSLFLQNADSTFLKFEMSE